MPRQAEPISPEDQTPKGGTCKLPDTESHVGCTSLKEGKKSKHSKRSSQTSHLDNKEKAVKTKHTKSKNESSAHIGSKYPSDTAQSINANKGPEKEIILDKNKREHVKKKRKHSKGETKHEKRCVHDDPNSEVINDHSLIKESVHKHKRRDKPHVSSKTSTVDRITHRSTTASAIYENNCQDASISVKEQRFEAASHGYTYEAVPGTPSSASICSSRNSRSSYSRSPIRSGKYERRRIHDPHVCAKSHKQRFERSSKSPSVHSAHEHKYDLPTRTTNIDHEGNLEENYNAMKRTQSSASPPPKTRRYDSSTLSYGYRQSTQRHHLSPNHRSHSKRHAPYRERSRSDSERFDSRRISTYRPGDKEHIHSKTYFAKKKPKYHNLDDDVHETRHSKNREHRDQHNAKKITSGSHRRDIRGDIESLSPSPKGSKQCRENYEPQQHSARQQLPKLQSDVHPPPVPARDRRDSYDSGSLSQKSTDNIPACIDSTHHPSHSPPSSLLPKDKERKSQASHAFYELLDELKCEDVSDTELTLIIPPSMISTLPSVTVSSCNSESISVSESSDKNNRTSNDNNNANSGHLDTEKIEKDDSSYQSKLNSTLNLASLEVLSTQIKQHMTSPENWDINDLDDPIELDEEYSEHTTDETNADLLNLKKPDDNLYTPWQELIESAGQKLSSDTIKSDEHDYVQCVGTFIAGVGHQNIIPLRQRANGLDALRRTGVSRTYFDSDLLQHLTINSNSSNEQSGENNLFQISVQLPNTWANDNCENSLTGSEILNQLFKLVLPLSRKTDGYLRQNLLRTTKCT